MKVNDPEKAEPDKFQTDGKFQLHSYAPVYPIPGPMMTNFNTQKAVTTAIDTKDNSVLKTPHAKTQYANVMKYFDAVNEGKKSEPQPWYLHKFWYGPTSTIGIQNYYFDKDAYLTTKLVGYETPEMSRKRSTLEDAEEETFIKIISGLEPLDSFDTFVDKWRNLGGEVIEYEVNEWYKENK